MSVHIRLTDEQKENIKTKAKKLGLTTSAFMRMASLQYDTNNNIIIQNMTTNHPQNVHPIEKKEEIIPIKQAIKKQSISKRVASIKDSRKNLFNKKSVKNILKKVE